VNKNLSVNKISLSSSQKRKGRYGIKNQKIKNEKEKTKKPLAESTGIFLKKFL
jgi:hypothetical protein